MPGWVRSLAIALVAACAISSPVRASNPYFNQPVCTANGDQSAPLMVSDGAGGAIIAWFDQRSGHDVYAQRVNAAGVAQWATNGVPVITSSFNEFGFGMASDGAGGAIFAWPNTAPTPGEFDIRAQRLDGTGTKQWAASGVVVCGAPTSQLLPSVVSDGAGGAIVLWQDGRGGSLADDIYAQRIDAAGAPQWTADGVSVCTATDEQDNIKAIPDGAGGVIVSWMDSRSGTSSVYVQRLDGAGTPQWTTNGVAVSTSPPTQFYQSLVSDGAGGAIVAWHDDNTYQSAVANIYGQRVDASGTRQWTTNGVAICSAPNAQQNVALAPDGSGGAFAAWADSRAGIYTSNIFAQRVDAAGVSQWAANGVPVSPVIGFGGSAVIAPDGTGGAIVAWTESRPASTLAFFNLYAQRLNGAGTLQWTATGVPVSIAAGTPGAVNLLPDGAGGVLFSFRDNRCGEFCYDIYAQQVDQLGAVINGPPETYGNISGGFTGYCPPAPYVNLYGVTVDAFSAGTGDLLATATTDVSGHFSMTGLLAIGYIVSVVTPLGYTTWPDQTVYVPAGGTYGYGTPGLQCTPTSGNPSSANFWKHQVGIATGGNGNAKVDGPTICTYLDLIQTHFNNNALNQVVVYDPPSGSTCAQKLNLLKALLNFGNSAADVDQARQQLIAVLLNVAAGNLALFDVISKDGATVTQAITYCDQLIDNPSGNRALAASIADKINGGQMVSAGVIPLGTQQIAYSRDTKALEFTVHPNPAGGARSFDFLLPAPTRVSLGIYDVSGRRLASVYEGALGAGRHTFRWGGAVAGGTTLRQGLYFAELKTDAGARVTRVVQASP